MTFLQLFVNKFPFTSNLSFLAYLGFTTPNFTINSLLLSRRHLIPPALTEGRIRTLPLTLMATAERRFPIRRISAGISTLAGPEAGRR